MSGNVEVIC